MNSKIVICLLVAIAAVVIARPDGYTTKFDSINIEEVFGNAKLYDVYKKCLLSDSDEDIKANCKLNEAKTLKELLPDAIETGCSKCNDVQKKKAKEAICILQKDHAEDWAALKSKYDPDGTYEKKYADQKC